MKVELHFDQNKAVLKVFFVLICQTKVALGTNKLATFLCFFHVFRDHPTVLPALLPPVHPDLCEPDHRAGCAGGQSGLRATGIF